MSKPWVFFDLDGTLANSLEAMYGVYIAFLETYDIKGTREEFEKLNGPSLKEIIPLLQKTHGLENERPERMLTDYLKRIEEVYRHSVQPMVHAGTTLQSLKKQGKMLLLATSGNREVAEDFLFRTGLYAFFDAFIYGDEVVQAKPSPEIYLRALKKAGIEAGHAIAVEDSAHGISSARDAGLDVILFTPEGQPKPEGMSQDLTCISDLLEILQLVKDWPGIA